MKNMKKSYSIYYLVLIVLWVMAMMHKNRHLGFTRSLIRLCVFSLVIAAYAVVSALLLKYLFGVKDVKAKLEIMVFSGRRGPVPFGAGQLLVASIGAFIIVLLLFWPIIARIRLLI